MQNDVYDYISAGSVQRNAVLRKTCSLLVLSFAPAAIGAPVNGKMGFSLYAIPGGRWMSFIVVMAFFYGMTFLIGKNRYGNVGATLLVVFTFGMGVLFSPLLQHTLNFSNGTQIVGIASVVTATVFFIVSTMACRATMNVSSLGRFLTVGTVVLVVAAVINFVLQIPTLSLTISTDFILFGSLMTMWQVHIVIDDGEDSHISTALTVFISLCNIFSSLLHLLTILAGGDQA